MTTDVDVTIGTPSGEVLVVEDVPVRIASRFIRNLEGDGFLVNTRGSIARHGRVGPYTTAQLLHHLDEDHGIRGLSAALSDSPRTVELLHTEAHKR